MAVPVAVSEELEQTDRQNRVLYIRFKVENNFKLKSHTLLLLVSNVVNRFTCPCNTGKTYVGMSSGQGNI